MKPKCLWKVERKERLECIRTLIEERKTKVLEGRGTPGVGSWRLWSPCRPVCVCVCLSHPCTHTSGLQHSVHFAGPFYFLTFIVPHSLLNPLLPGEPLASPFLLRSLVHSLALQYVKWQAAIIHRLVVCVPLSVVFKDYLKYFKCSPFPNSYMCFYGRWHVVHLSSIALALLP